MAHDAALGERVRRALSGTAGLAEKEMFGGLCFLVNGHMCAGIVGSTLMVRIGAEGYQEALARPHVRPMDFTGRPSKSMVYVRPAGLRVAALARWIGLGVRFVTSR